MDMCDADLRKTRSAAREISYFNKPQQKQQFTFQKRNEPQTRQVNYGCGRPKNSFESAHHQNYSNRHRNQVNDERCYRHRTQGYSATRCDSPNTCPMRDIIALLTSKNGHPSSSQ